MNAQGIPEEIEEKNIKIFIGTFSFYGECIEFDIENEIIHLKETDDNILLININSIDAMTIINEEEE